MHPLFAPWTWRDASWSDDRASDHDTAGAHPGVLVGYEVEATDGGIGKIAESDADAPADCLVVDTGPWIFGREVVLPVGTVRRVDHDERKVYVDRTREQIKNAPERDPDEPDHEGHRQRIGDYYTESYRLIPPML
ncbi:PRC-barrel domain containing protein [Saccharothrix obliqua]|uniref:PRC-barrel domain containing protein n=1 Tax=Saccharothrix obliqua TaxID=2861747 RepID=UPI001C5D11EF|nr:PRC-barrel domain containing protein [Saccharothrix obliqua]MBW4718659.1 PRC-barrel domain containing protein [Saccharothrix obliqua]